MADKPVTEVVHVDAALDALVSPTSSDVYEAVDAFNEKAVAAVAAKRAMGAGGGSQPVKKVTIAVADIQADPFGDGTPGAPLIAVPANALFAVLGDTVTEGFNDSGAAGNPVGVRDATNAVDLSNLSNAIYVNSANTQAVPPWWDPSSWGFNGFVSGAYPTAAAEVWLTFPVWSLDGDTGSVDFFLFVGETA